MLYLSIAGAVQVSGFLLRISLSAGGQERILKAATVAIPGTLGLIVAKRLGNPIDFLKIRF
jgi:hypothetical protein